MARSWLEELLANLQGEGGPQPYREGIPPGSVTSAPISDARPYVPFAMADPMADHGNVPQPPAVGAFGMPIAPPAWPSGPAGSTPVDEAAAAAAAREAAGARMIAANQRHTGPFAMPGMDSAGVQLAMDQAPAGTGVPVPGSPQFQPFGIPPSMAAAKEMAAPPQMQPQAPIAGLNAPIGGAPGAVPAGAPTDVSAARRPPVAPPGAPMGIPGPVAPPDAVEPSMMQRFGGGLSAAAPALLGLGAALSGDQGHLTVKMAADREAKALLAQQGNATARLLQSKGADPAEVQAAIAGGPDTVKALLGQYLTKDKFAVTQIGETEDKYGAKKKVFKVFNAADGTFKEIPADNAAAAKTAAESQDLEGVTGADRLAALHAKDPTYARKVQSAVNGDMSLPTGRAALTTAGQKFIEDVLGVDGTVSEADFKVRQQVRKNYTSGKDFQVTKSINTVVDHGSQLEKAIKDLGNYNYFSGIVNPVRDKYLSQTDPKYIAAKHSYDVNAEGFAREMDFALSGGRPTVSGAEHQRKAFDQLAAQVGQQAALRKSIEMLDARLHEHQRGYEEALPPGTKEAIVPRLEKKTTDFIRRIVGNGAPGAASGAVKPGNYVWKNGALVPQ